MVNFVPSSNVAMTSPSGRAGIAVVGGAGAVWAHTAVANTNAQRDFMGVMAGIAVPPVYHGTLADYLRESRDSPRLTCALRRPSSRFPDAFFLPASLTWTLLLTATAPAVLAMRVAALL